MIPATMSHNKPQSIPTLSCIMPGSSGKADKKLDSCRLILPQTSSFDTGATLCIPSKEKIAGNPVNKISRAEASVSFPNSLGQISMAVYAKWTLDEKGRSLLKKEADTYEQMLSLQDKVIPLFMGYYEYESGGNFKFGILITKLYKSIPDATNALFK